MQGKVSQINRYIQEYIVLYCTVGYEEDSMRMLSMRLRFLRVWVGGFFCKNEELVDNPAVRSIRL